MKTGHTAGPWKRFEYKDESDGQIHIGVSTNYKPRLCNGDRSIVLTTGGAYMKDDKHRKPQLIKENRANARLIAAAPELLTACDIAVAAMCGNGYGDQCGMTKIKQSEILHAIGKGKAAIAKAKGE